MEQSKIASLIETALKAAYHGGLEINKVYDSEFAIEHKEDKSPLTLADKNAHIAIKKILDDTGLPQLSEEGKTIEFSDRSSWQSFWMIDPLDGTKEFIKRNGEFTVNIALIENGAPIAGVIYVSVKKVLYFGIVGWGAYKIENYNGESFSLDALKKGGLKMPHKTTKGKFTVVGSRSHMSPETEKFINELKESYGDIEMVSMGSSLKICLVAEGVADVYPRFAPTMEWDTAAGQAIAEAAGKKVIDYVTQEPMVYNKENLLNNWFLVN
jgi:3'(2'), 5'-bisphosphate nucleotidase